MSGEPTRPLPPSILFEDPRAQFLPAPELEQWMRETFIEAGATLENEDHAHLRAAEIKVLWTNVPNGRHGRTIVGQCELGTPRAMGRWAKARAEMQVLEWFGSIPDFIITIDAEYAQAADDASFCALVEHELYHGGQEIDEFGAPKFTREGSPKFAMRGHDVEEFVGVVARYGVEATQVDAMVQAAKAGPTVALARISRACGTCQPALRAA